jgi:ClpP class serine protease
MSDVAASGGYWIATPAAKIIADANTITGSIGVLTGKLNLSGLYNLLGVSSDYIATSDNATLFSDQQNFTPAQEAYIKKSLDDTYAEFTEGVAKGRHMSVSAVEKIAKGREWSGSQGKELGLVDELGGFDRAVEVAKELAHIPATETVHLVRFPQEKKRLGTAPTARAGQYDGITFAGRDGSSSRWHDGSGASPHTLRTPHTVGNESRRFETCIESPICLIKSSASVTSRE